MNLSDEISAFQCYLEARRMIRKLEEDDVIGWKDGFLDEMAEDLEKSREAMEVAWLEQKIS